MFAALERPVGLAASNGAISVNWEAIGAIGETLGAIAVLVTLMYLAAQIGQNTKSVTTATYDSVMSAITQTNVTVASNPDLASILLRGSLDPDSLDTEEAFRYSSIMRSYANQWLKQLRLYEQGALSARDWERLAQEAAQALATPGGKVFRAGNHVFEDVYTEIDKYDSREISDFALGRRAR